VNILIVKAEYQLTKVSRLIVG